MPSRSAWNMIGVGNAAASWCGRDSARTPRRRPRSSRSLRASRRRAARRQARSCTPEFRNASSRSRCSSVAKSNSVIVKVSVDGRKVTSRAALALRRVADDRQRRRRIAVAEAHEVLLAVAPDAQLEPARQRVHHRDADAVQAARHLVGVLVELSAGMQLGHDDLGRRNAFFLVDVGRDAAAVVAHRARAVGVQRDGHLGRMAGQRLVDRVVDDLVDHVVQARAVVGVADIHARPLAHRVEALQDLDRLRAVVGSEGRSLGGRVRP